jgi:hypothetical protein
MVLVKILKRKDATSVILAIFLAMVLIQFVQSITLNWANWLSGLNYGRPVDGSGWKQEYLLPVVSAVLSLLVLEVLCRIYIWGAKALNRK